MIRVQDRDLASLNDRDRRVVRRLQRSYVELWTDVLCRLDRGLDLEGARVRAHAVFGLLNSTPHSGRLPDPQLHDVLRDMAHGALGLA